MIKYTEESIRFNVFDNQSYYGKILGSTVLDYILEILSRYNINNVDIQSMTDSENRLCYETAQGHMIVLIMQYNMDCYGNFNLVISQTHNRDVLIPPDCIVYNNITRCPNVYVSNNSRSFLNIICLEKQPKFKNNDHDNVATIFKDNLYKVVRPGLVWAFLDKKILY